MVNRDLKHLSSKAKAGAKKRSSPASRAQKKPLPGWLWLLAGLGIGLLVAALLYFGSGAEPEVQNAAAQPAPASVSAPKVVPPPPKVEEGEKVTEDRFEFYHLLSKLEVIIPDSEIKALQEHIAPRKDLSYIIQAGSFRRYGDADSVKAQLALLGIEAEVQKVESKGVDWYRVRVGPFDSSRKLNKVRNRIHAADINTIVIKIEKEG